MSALISSLTERSKSEDLVSRSRTNSARRSKSRSSGRCRDVVPRRRASPRRGSLALLGLGPTTARDVLHEQLRGLFALPGAYRGVGVDGHAAGDKGQRTVWVWPLASTCCRVASCCVNWRFEHPAEQRLHEPHRAGQLAERAEAHAACRHRRDRARCAGGRACPRRPPGRTRGRGRTPTPRRPRRAPCRPGRGGPRAGASRRRADRRTSEPTRPCWSARWAGARDPRCIRRPSPGTGRDGFRW